ncbi:MAG: hypothetical protein OEX00_05620 [Gammaproteobacteria bacterium]|nr:hypothetical protein [Gammaproteobacteria bacterium]MDH5693735.1 hypothetical protein [Gammaproteobacteria bacterium]
MPLSVPTTLVPFNGVSPRLVDQIACDLEGMGYDIRIEQTQIPLTKAFNSRRKQYSADPILNFVRRFSGQRVLGIMFDDIYRYVLDYVNGMADLPGRAALVSTCRLGEEQGDNPLVRKRLLELSLHELGHTFGLEHCPTPRCAMYGGAATNGWLEPVVCYCESCRKALTQKRNASY